MNQRLSDHPVYVPLKRAVEKNDADAVQSLLWKVDSVEKRTDLTHRALRWAFAKQSLQSFEVLLSPPALFTPSIEVFEDHSRALWIEMINRHPAGSVPELSAFVHSLVNAKLPLQHPNYGYHHPLDHAIRLDRLDWVEAFLKAGAHPDGGFGQACKNPNGPPLLFATSVAMVELLLENGANVSAASPQSSFGVAGGMSHLLHQWPRENELGLLWDAFVRHGGSVESVMQMSNGDKVPLGVEIMFRQIQTPILKAFEVGSDVYEKLKEGDAKMRARRHLLQELLVGRGLDLKAASSYRLPWGEFIAESGSPRLQRQLELEKTLPKAKSPGGKPRF